MKTKNMITETDLFTAGWRRFGDEGDDPYYKIILEPKVFNLDSLCGNFTEDGAFEIYSIRNRVFTRIDQITELFRINRFEVNWGLMATYGSDVPLRK